jgi:tRNA(Ile)-lysidine synthase
MNGCAPTAASQIPRNTEVLRVAVAASGGRDSTALLHCTAKAAAALGVEVIALHVHHGLNDQADAWLAHVRAQCTRWHVAFDCRRLQAQPQPGESVEAWARQARYVALREMAQQAACGLVLLAHHRRDQAETFLLQALRAGGPAGLSAMPRHAQDAGLLWARPWLNQPRQAIEAYVRRHRLKHIEDGSNNDLRFARNRLRAQIWPALQQAFPDAEVALCGAARRAQEATALAAEVAALDMPAVLDGVGLHVARWCSLSQARRLNALRAWLLQSLARSGPQSLLDRLVHELPVSKTGQWQAPDAKLLLYRGVLRVAAPALPPEPIAADELLVDLSLPGRLCLPLWQGHFTTAPVLAGGVSRAALKTAVVRHRQGGEQFQFSANAVARSLKKQYQSRALPAWQRAGPLLFSAQGQLLFVPGLGVNAAAQASPGEPQLSLHWQSLEGQGDG